LIASKSLLVNEDFAIVYSVAKSLDSGKNVDFGLADEGTVQGKYKTSPHSRSVRVKRLGKDNENERLNDNDVSNEVK
jgi:hypothetical protein